ncbi:MAG: 4-hydroxythreonine-4-phosphate dehydrogenase PdxA [Clostridiaceae bacterium]|jgi:4-hydroxythreonine-4-phosphate dehydrogenase|nr:4-hydroxythreonine-4-phosphate dehydrogenase PdxA [Clostridiaceae bacterium]
MTKQVIGIPLGDPAGIGPEIVIKALKEKSIYEACKPLVIGSLEVLKQMEDILGTGCTFNVVSEPSDGLYKQGTIDLVDLGNVDTKALRPGEVQAEAGRAAYEYIACVTKLAMSGKVAAIATTPINKEAIKAAGIEQAGHTEILAELTGTYDPLTMFQVRGLRVFFLSRHVPLRRACDMVTRERLIEYIERCSQAMRRLGMHDSTLAVAGLNPHNGEHGLFGDEEGSEMEPAICEAAAKGISVVGPVPADSVFHQALHGKYGAVLSLYHDQGHIATKTLDFERTISLTIGMPFLRTSVDHGTAFDIAGKGIAGAIGMQEAIRLAALYAPGYGTGGS